MNLRQSATAVALLLALAACSGNEPKPGTAAPTGFDVPAGVTLTAEGATMDSGKPASVIYRVADNARSAVTVTVDKVVKGDIKDFKFFSLDDASRKSTPYYVRSTLKNEGPAGLGGAPVPLYAHDSSNSIKPPNDIVGDFTKCEPRELPKSLLPGDSADVCLVYLVAEGTELVSIDLQTADMKQPVSWKP